MAGASTINQHQETVPCDYFPGDIVYRLNQGQLEVGVVRKSQKDEQLDGPVDKLSNNQVDDDEEVMVVLEISKKGLSPEKVSSELIVTRDDNAFEELGTATITVSWFPDYNCEVISKEKVHLMDRSIRIGEAVRLMNSKENEYIGYCKKIHKKLCLKINGTNTVIESVSSDDFEVLHPVRPGDICIHRPWIGFIENFGLAITLQTKDGSLVVVNCQDLCNFEEAQGYISSKFYRSKDHHVGQKLIGPWRDLLRGNWIHQSLEMKAKPLASKSPSKGQVEVTVTKVRVDSISCKWFFCAADIDGEVTNFKVKGFPKNQESGESNTQHPPKPCKTLSGNQLEVIRVIDYFHKYNIKIGDVGYYEIKNSDKLIDLDQFVESFHEEKLRGESTKTANVEKQLDQFEMFYDDSSMTDDEENVDYDDYSEEGDDTMDFEQTLTNSSPPDKKIVTSEKTASASALTDTSAYDWQECFTHSTPQKSLDSGPRRKTAVQIIATESKVDVVWRCNQVTNDILSCRLHPMHHLTDHQFYPGSPVIDNKEGVSCHDYGVVQEFHPDSSIALVKWFKSKAIGVKPSLHSEEYVGTYDIKVHPTYHYRTGSCVIRTDDGLKSSFRSYISSKVGQVVECNIDGQILCAWADRSQSTVYPQDISIIKDKCQYFDDGESTNGMTMIRGIGTLGPFKETVFNKHTTQSTPIKRKMPSTVVSSETLVEKIKITALQLEEYFIQNPSPNYQNGISIMNRIYKLAHLCKSLDETVGTSLVTSEAFRSLLQEVNPTPSSSSGAISMIGDQLRKLLKSSSTASSSSFLEKKESQSFNDICDESYESYHENLIEVLIEELSTTTSEASSEINRAINIPSCLEFLKQFKTSLSSVISNLQPKKPYTNEPDIEIIYQSHDPDAPSTSSGFGIIGEKKSPTEGKEPKVEKPSTVTSPQIEAEDNQAKEDVWQMVVSAPVSHKFISSVAQPTDQMIRILRREIFLLKSSLPPDIHVKAFEDRLDLFSAMIKGPQGTPYEDALFLFDIYLPASYPKVPPKVHYISYCTDRLNPNLYECGKVCVSLLGTWRGKGNEMWNAKGSNLLQLLLSIQALILVAEPYFNEPGWEGQKGTASGRTNSKAYNEKVVLKTVQSMTKMITNPHEPFKQEIYQHCTSRAKYFIDRIETWISISENWNKTRAKPIPTDDKQNPAPQASCQDLLEFPLLPGTTVFCTSLTRALNEFKKKLSSLNIKFT